MDAQQWIELAKAVGGTLLTVSLAALSAPVTLNRLRLWNLERLNNVIDKMPTVDPSRPYFEAERRKRAAWWTATNQSRMSATSRAVLIWEFSFVVIGVWAVIEPDPPGYPYMPWWLIASLGLFAALRVLMALRRMRSDRVHFYNSLIEAGPEEFKGALKKPLGIPRLFGQFPEDGTLRRLPTRSTSHHLEVENIRACPNGHPVTGGSLLVTDYDWDKTPPRTLLCSRCLAPLPRPLTRDIDEEERDIAAIRAHRKLKAEKKKAAAKETATGEQSEPPANEVEVESESR